MLVQLVRFPYSNNPCPVSEHIICADSHIIDFFCGNRWIHHVTVCLATSSFELANMATAGGYSVVLFGAFMAQTFVFATKTKGKVVLVRTVSGKA